MIVADDLGWNDVGYNNKKIETPFIDSLANTGIKMNQFYVQTVCTPTRSAIMTGFYPFKLGLQKLVWPWSSFGLPQDKKTIAEYFKELNYKTYAVGKWNLGHSHVNFLPTYRGFDHHYGCYAGCQDYYDHNYYGIHDFFEDNKVIYPQGHSTDLYADKACEYIKKHDGSNPFFMYVAFTAPHVPLKCDNYWENKNQSNDETRRKYLGLVSHMDYCIGKIVANLKSKKIYEDTLIWFTADNGGWIGCGGDNQPYKGGKCSLNEGGIKAVNFIQFKKFESYECNQVSHAIDIMPTLISLAGGSVDFSDGIDLTQSIRDKKNTDRNLVFQYYPNGESFIGACRFGKWKLIIQKDIIELYDLSIDPCEMNNLAQKMPEIVNDIISKMKTNESKFLQGEWPVYFSPNGPPLGYQPPKYYKPHKDIKMSFIKKSEEVDLNLDFMDVLGYPPNFDVKSLV